MNAVTPNLIPPPLAEPAEWADPRAVAHASDEALAILTAKPRARPPRVKVMMLVDHYLGQHLPPTVLQALAIPLAVIDYAAAQARQAAIRRGREAGRPAKDIAADIGFKGTRSTRSRKPPKTRPKNADLYDALVAGPVTMALRLAVAKSLGLLGQDGSWRYRVLTEARHVIHERELFSRAAKLEGEARARRADAGVCRPSDGDVEELRQMFATVRAEVVANGGDVSLLDEALDFQAQEDARVAHYNRLHRTGEQEQARPVDEAVEFKKMLKQDHMLRARRRQVLSADSIAEHLGIDREVVAVWMRRDDWEIAVAPYGVWDNWKRTRRAK